MRTITKYQAHDGTEFLDAEKCQKHEAICLKIDETISKLGSNPGTCDFSNGSGYIQHEAKLFLSARKELLEIAKQFSDHKWLQQSIDMGLDADPSWAGRIIYECGNDALSKAWYRISCTDTHFREWGQPFFRNNPDQAKFVQLN